MIRLNCFISVKEENKKTVMEAAKRLTAASQEQDGCVAYDIFESATRPEVLMFCETWRDKEALAAHSDSEVFKEEVKIISGHAEMKLESFEF